MSTSGHEGSMNAGSSTGRGEAVQDFEKTRLTKSEKKANHIASEQKRRQAIREGFDRLTEIVPGTQGQGRSEAVVLQRTVEYIRTQLEENQKLVSRIESLGGQVEKDLRE